MLNHIFSPENKFFVFMEKIMNSILVGFLWFLFSLPVVTVGAASCGALRYGVMQAGNEEGYVFRTFFVSFRENLKQAVAAWLIILAAGIFLTADLYLCLNLTLPPFAERVSYTVLLCLLICLLLTALYLFPLQSVVQMNLKQLFLHSFFTAVAHLPITFLIIVIDGICCALIYLFPLFLPFWAGLGIFLTSYFYRYVLSEFFEK